jgi:hypothetical protein
MILMAFFFWFYRIDFYPFTSWHYLYNTSNTSGQVEYKQVWAQRESGVRFRARLEETIGALAWDARYSRFLTRCFQDQPRYVEICTKFLSAAAAAYNQKVPPGERVTQYEIQVWNWDFRAYPFDPNYGSLTQRFVFEINTGRALRETTLANHSRSDSVPPRASEPVKDSRGSAR